ncbi:TadE/TadG family type IV pilus assembly protein [Rosistilla oblonga]|uniref:TadE-like protein n=1 Tax=Rosistilla oblonga TaxID=2527990 RepID=A0A518IUU5_9BACT|nr:TadE/TadG family type IV pilus assembly protein [Rosistilla oblonga]QDV56864.1 TadE-like protein [Rosistilla oblonga]
MNNNQSHRRQPIALRSPRSRRGAVAVEFALTAGIAIAFFFASFEFCRVAMIRHTVDNAVYEAARTGIVPGATSNEVRTKANEILATIGITNANVKVTPANISSAATNLTVDITVPIEKNAFGASLFFKGKSVQRALTMARETAQ